MKVKAVCIDDKNKPAEIPQEKWIKKGETYHVKHVYNMVKQGMMLGCDLWEINLKGCDPYGCYRLSRFAFDIKDVGKLIELMQACSELKDVNIDELMEQVEDLQLEEELV